MRLSAAYGEWEDLDSECHRNMETKEWKERQIQDKQTKNFA